METVRLLRVRQTELEASESKLTEERDEALADGTELRNKLQQAGTALSHSKQQVMNLKTQLYAATNSGLAKEGYSDVREGFLSKSQLNSMKSTSHYGKRKHACKSKGQQQLSDLSATHSPTPTLPTSQEGTEKYYNELRREAYDRGAKDPDADTARRASADGKGAAIRQDANRRVEVCVRGGVGGTAARRGDSERAEGCGPSDAAALAEPLGGVHRVAKAAVCARCGAGARERGADCHAGVNGGDDVRPCQRGLWDGDMDLRPFKARRVIVRWYERTVRSRRRTSAGNTPRGWHAKRRDVHWRIRRRGEEPRRSECCE